ncbi:AraC family transcriptional regulator [Aquimarina sp. AD10]|uniref:helix-turn-helix domain-containing protein n=1 Tax=Aquimarina sp. AD10 TaxID=1714849 RepID=UPI000E5166F7|nr:helix-turn-helix domain-containing protein [Aquimarina sp. AD10]AXT61528.1 AraC family transcriptional regulator [Aquimarina sp. AD10]RKM90012.1 helix-turn-helix domain-containing protein [Aquimarina sp. AD10]
MQLKQYHKFIFFLFFISLTGYGQSFVVPDSLKSKTYEELKAAFLKTFETDKFKAKIYIDIYSGRAKNTGDSSNIARSYGLRSLLYSPLDIKRIQMLDSAILYGKNADIKHYPELLYNKRALSFRAQGDPKNQLKDYLMALKYAKRDDNEAYVYLVKKNISYLKMGLGKYNEARAILKECIAYHESNMEANKGKWDTIYYLRTLSSLSSAYRLNNQLDSARVLNQKGLKFKSLRRDDRVSIFDLDDAILDYFDERYVDAKSKLEGFLPIFIDSISKDVYENDIIYAYFYLGKANKALNEIEEAFSYFKKVDSLLKGSNYFMSEQRQTYFELADYYKEKNDYPNQLEYIDKLLKVDSALNNNYRLVSDQLLLEFDTPKLLEEKQKVITALEAENKIIYSKNIIISLLLGLSLFGVIYYNYRQRLFKKRFIQLRDKTAKKDDASKQSSGSTLNKETVNNLLDQLQKFEESKGFLKATLNAKDLAKSFGSNSSYLSKVINTFKEKTFSTYINDLRIDFVIDRLQKDRMFRKYTIKAIAQEIGFNNAEAFSKAFYKNTGIYPSYFIKELEK